MMRLPLAVLLIVQAAALSPAGAQGFRVEDVASIAAVPLNDLKPRTVIFSERHEDKLADPATGLLSFADWARERPVERRFLSLFPEFDEPLLKSGARRTLSMYVAEARFRLSKPEKIPDLSRYANITFLERIDPAIKHREISPLAAIPNVEADLAYALPPNRKWCMDGAICLQSRYKFEGKIPIGIRLVNKLRDESKRPIPDFIAFQSEIRVIGRDQPDFADIGSLTGVNGAFLGALEQSVFWANQVVQFAKLLAVVQEHPTERGDVVATIYVVLAVRNDVLDRQKQYGNAPILRNLVPAQLLMGRSSFNSGDSISAGLPTYARSRVKAIADIIERE